jgi:hypothetical protein
MGFFIRPATARFSCTVKRLKVRRALGHSGVGILFCRSGLCGSINLSPTCHLPQLHLDWMPNFCDVPTHPTPLGSTTSFPITDQHRSRLEDAGAVPEPGRQCTSRLSYRHRCWKQPPASTPRKQGTAGDGSPRHGGPGPGERQVRGQTPWRGQSNKERAITRRHRLNMVIMGGSDMPSLD